MGGTVGKKKKKIQLEVTVVYEETKHKFYERRGLSDILLSFTVIAFPVTCCEPKGV